MKSSRIKRRNACGFKGEGTVGTWVKTSPWGGWNEDMKAEYKKTLRMKDRQREIGKNGNRNNHHHNHSNFTLNFNPLATINPLLR